MEYGPEKTVGGLRTEIKNRHALNIRQYSSYSAFDISCLRSDFCIINQKEILLKCSAIFFFSFQPSTTQGTYWTNLTYSIHELISVLRKTKHQI